VTEVSVWLAALLLPLILTIGGLISRKAGLAVPLFAALPLVYIPLLLWIGLMPMTRSTLIIGLLLTAMIEGIAARFWRAQGKAYLQLVRRTVLAALLVGVSTCGILFFVALAKEGF
jgi:hypothetical protein